MNFKKMKTNKVILVILLNLLWGLFSATAFAAVGYDLKMLSNDNPERPLPLHIWYPAGTDGQAGHVGKNAVFIGTMAHHDATPLAGSHPVIVLSHGSGGNALGLGWIANSLAERGIVVIATNHPGTTSRDSSPHKTLKVWQRTQDVSRILDYIEQGGLATFSLDQERVGVMGFSLGGHTALGVVGARVNRDDYIRYCDQFPQGMDCQWFRRGDVDFQSIDPVIFEQSNLDARVKVAVSIDPGIAQAYVSESLQAIALPVQIINLGLPGEVPLAVEGAEIAQLLQNVEYKSVAGSSHFSFLPECTEMGVEIIRSEGEEPICTEVGGRDRGDIHRELKALIGEFLEKNLL